MSYELYQKFLALRHPREHAKMVKAVRNQVRLMHKTHWHGVKTTSKLYRRLRYWDRVYRKLSARAGGLMVDFKPRGKRRAVYAAFLERERAVATADALRDLEGASKSPTE